LPLRTWKLLRAVCALLAVGTYGLPTVVGVVSQLGHDVEHLLQGVWGHDAADEGQAAAADIAAGGFVHAHGGAEHAHDGRLGQLLVAAEQTEEHQDDAVITAFDGAGHLPALRPTTLIMVVDAVSTASAPESGASGLSLRPPLPPPRA
jgi:hypothetical protein